MIDWTKPVESTYDERPVRVLCTDREDKRYPVVLLVGSTVETCTLDGFASTEAELPAFRNVRRTVYINVVPHRNAGSPHVYYFAHDTRELADKHAWERRLARLKVTYSEGQFDE